MEIGNEKKYQYCHLICSEEVLRKIASELKIDFQKVDSLFEILSVGETNLETIIENSELENEQLVSIIQLMSKLDQTFQPGYEVQRKDVEDCFEIMNLQNRPVFPKVSRLSFQFKLEKLIEEQGSYVYYEKPNNLQSSVYGLTAVPRTTSYSQKDSVPYLLNTAKVFKELKQFFEDAKYQNDDFDELIYDVEKLNDSCENINHKLILISSSLIERKEDIQEVVAYVNLSEKVCNGFDKMLKDYDEYLETNQISLSEHLEIETHTEYHRDDTRAEVSTSSRISYPMIKKVILERIEKFREPQQEIKTALTERQEYLSYLKLSDIKVRSISIEEQIRMALDIDFGSLNGDELLLKKFYHYFYYIAENKHWLGRSKDNLLLKMALDRVLGLFEDDHAYQILANEYRYSINLRRRHWDDFVKNGLIDEPAKENMIHFFEDRAARHYREYLAQRFETTKEIMLDNNIDVDWIVCDRFMTAFSLLNIVCQEKIHQRDCYDEISISVFAKYMKEILDNPKEFQCLKKNTEYIRFLMDAEQIDELKEEDYIDGGLVRKLNQLGDVNYKMAALKAAVGRQTKKIVKGKKI